MLKALEFSCPYGLVAVQVLNELNCFIMYGLDACKMYAVVNL